jgi:hypothetical protein
VKVELVCETTRPFCQTMASVVASDLPPFLKEEKCPGCTR